MGDRLGKFNLELSQEKTGSIRFTRFETEKSESFIFKWLNRRSQRKSYNWRGFSELLSQFKIPQPWIIGYWN